MKQVSTIILIIKIVFFFLLNPDISARPASVPKEAKWYALEADDGFWKLEVQDKEKKIETLWYKSGKIRASGLQIGKWQLTKIFYENGNLEELTQRYFGKIWVQASNQTHDGLLTVGKTFGYYENGKLKNISCSDLDIYEGSENENCGIEYKFDESGKLLETIDHKRKCKMGCGRFRPFLNPGKYFSTTNSLRVREKPDKKAKVVGTLSKGDEVVLIKDTGKVETIEDERAPWVEIRAKNGTKGYVFGGFLYEANEYFP